MKYSKNTLMFLVSILLSIMIVEIASYLILKFNKNLQFEKPYFNRELSPYYIFRNTPGYKTKSIKKSDNEKDIVIDENGFISENKLDKIKPDSTIRIFLTGGSGAFGNGQSEPYDRIKKYPGGVYSFQSSIAGQLQIQLSKKYPNYNFEVVNASASGRMINQSIGLYISLIKDLSPDIVISMDGMNDITSMNGISPYSEKPVSVFNNYL